MQEAAPRTGRQVLQTREQQRTIRLRAQAGLTRPMARRRLAVSRTTCIQMLCCGSRLHNLDTSSYSVSVLVLSV